MVQKYDENYDRRNELLLQVFIVMKLSFV